MDMNPRQSPLFNYWWNHSLFIKVNYLQHFPKLFILNYTQKMIK